MSNLDTNEVFIVGGGPSLRGFDFFSLLNKKTIVVNKAILNVPNPNYFITVDYTFISKLGLDALNNCYAHKYFVVDLSRSFMEKVDGVYVDTRFNLRYCNLSYFNTIIESKDQNGFGFDFNDFRSGANSGYSALQLAIVLGFTKIYLLGFDLRCDYSTHYHQGYGESPESFRTKLNEYYLTFVNGIQEIKQKFSTVQIFSCSQISSLNNLLPYYNISELS